MGEVCAHFSFSEGTKGVECTVVPAFGEPFTTRKNFAGKIPVLGGHNNLFQTSQKKICYEKD